MTSRISAGEAAPVPLGPAAVLARVLLPFGIGFFLSYLLRTVNAVIAPQLTHEIGLTPADLGLLTAIFFIAFATIQVPLGVMLDRYGPRRVQVTLLWATVAGAVLFGLGESFAVLAVGRALIGLGMAGCLMSALKANAMWWSAERLPLINNLSVIFGSLGAMAATAPVEVALRFLDWHELFLVCAGLTVAVIALTALVVPETETGLNRSERTRDQFAAIAGIFRSALFWRVGALFMACSGVSIGYLTLWAGPWLKDVAGLDRADVALHLLLAQLGTAVGVLGTGFLATAITRLGVPLVRVIAVGVTLYLAVQIALALGTTSLAIVLWPAFSMFGSTTFLCYAVLTPAFGSAMTGRVLTAANMLVFIAVFAVQWAVGAIIELFPTGPDGAIPPDAHNTALGVMIAIEASALVWFVWPRRRAVS